ncbi:MAG TPA: urease accessory protein [Rhodobacteraceae bacterium]|nr:urease accessory protein [Paracoccaceae bacterium]
MFPRRDGAGLEAVLVNTAGGITGGDRFEIAAHVDAGAGLTLTSQTAERAYAAPPGETGRVETRLDVGPGGRLGWIPQETILFDHSALSRRLIVTLAPGATALVAEPVIFGRAAMGEEVRFGRFDDRIEIRRDGRPLYRDAMRLNGDTAARLDRPHAGGGARALVSLVYVAPDAEAQLAAVRSALPPTGGASLIGDDVLALRLLATDGFELRRVLIPILTRLTGGDLPKCWMI